MTPSDGSWCVRANPGIALRGCLETVRIEFKAGGRSRKLYQEVVDIDSRATRAHGLQAVPTSVGRPKAARVLMTVAATLDAPKASGWAHLGSLRMIYGDRKWIQLQDVANAFAADVK